MMAFNKIFGLPFEPNYPQIAPVGAVGPVGRLGAGLIGGAAGLFGGMLLGGSKKEQTVAQAQEMATVIHPYGVYTPTYAPTVSQMLDYSVIIESPGAAITTKKEATQTPTFTITPTISPGQQQAATQAQGMDMTTIAVVAVIGVIAYALITKKKGGKK